jgi:type II secretory ATPase GspE/PulE/Tfp pilus assembly ATPase PilB-like protein
MSQNARFDEEQATERRARILGYDYYDTSSADKPLYKDILSVDQIKQFKAVVISADKYHINFGILTTTSQQNIQYMNQHFLDQQLSFAIISDAGYREYLALYDPPPQVVYQDIDITKANSNEISNISAVLEQVKADDMLAYIVQQAHRLNASDIHLESHESGARVRFRIDGVLHIIANLNLEKYRMLISAIASAGNVSTASTSAQQGHIAQKVTMADGSSVAVNVRLETVQTIYGMDVVMRLFNMDEKMFKLDQLGLSEEEKRVVESIIDRPNGLVLIVGPTGSGKTTTLYSMLNSLVNDERKIITIEDPVEYQFKGITQIPVSSANAQEVSSFGEKLRAVLRLDPDVIMVGEIRDPDTARTALQAALTGHLVLSTFHAASAAATLTRLADVIGYNPLFISSIRLIMAQRLVRKLDDSSKVAYTPDELDMRNLHEIVNSMPAEKRPNLENVQLYKPGSSESNPFGYTGQIAIREQLLMTEEIVNILSDSSRLITTDDIELAAMKGGMQTMMQDAALKVLAGQTTMEEIYRVL